MLDMVTGWTLYKQGTMSMEKPDPSQRDAEEHAYRRVCDRNKLNNWGIDKIVIRTYLDDGYASSWVF